MFVCDFVPHPLAYWPLIWAYLRVAHISLRPSFACCDMLALHVVAYLAPLLVVACYVCLYVQMIGLLTCCCMCKRYCIWHAFSSLSCFACFYAKSPSHVVACLSIALLLYASHACLLRLCTYYTLLVCILILH